MNVMKVKVVLFFLIFFVADGYSASSYRLIAYKAGRRLELYRNDSLLKTYRVALGLAPSGNKDKRGDFKTPEGDYYLCMKNEHSQFYLSFEVSYPNKTDAKRGLDSGLISKTEYRAICWAIDAGKEPPQNTALGGNICIHGNGTSRDWTWGCIALEDPDIKELFELLPTKTPVTIKP